MIKHYHIWRGDKRTSVSVHSTLDIMLALRLAGSPDTDDKKAKKAVIKWVQETINRESEPNQKNLSQWLQGQALDFIMSGKDMPQLWENWKNESKDNNT